MIDKAREVEIEKKKKELVVLKNEVARQKQRKRDLEWEINEIEDDIEGTEHYISELENLLSRGFIDFASVKTAKDSEEVEWLKLAKADYTDSRRVLHEINYDADNKWLCATNGMMLFLIKDIEETEFKPIERYPNIKTLFIDYKLSEIFNPAKLEYIDLKYVKYTTETGCEIGFTADLLRKVLYIGDEIKVSYSSSTENVQFTCGKRLALLMPIRDFTWKNKAS
jgi:hypothetical protein